jgi:ATP-binding cassette subfamily B protein
MGLPEGTDPLTALAQMPEEAVQQIMSQMDEKLKDMPESIVTQAGVSFVASEYEALGTGKICFFCIINRMIKQSNI